ncbi:HesA/MoeB/ThiF family protein [Picrophilus oshimae]|uniref:Molybdopterin biosynthesis MoeB protein n=1 Tax=Picrophilus torridus (strain ATCC 700027 / DSM 9790 / JCM 10055 / NBRC 100828 / KAW 2/3) TaxID=1122961 RepID=Q6L1P6_PICTO|nr:ThiF family adenylyltransferase [Picrophilus oshimae]AAT43106.1 molybdopterin biosynthesis MoeB protein [Picrophilus oshimae DSM 9789]
MRYSRQEIIKFIGKNGQKKIRKTKALVIGAGGTGSYTIMSLAMLGFGRIHVIDDDKIEITNLNRQALYNEDDLGSYKAETIFKRIKKINSLVNISYETSRFDSSNYEIVKDFDIVFDCTDNITTRMIINDACDKFRIPWVFMAVSEFYGQVKLINPGITACFACYNRDPGEIPNCDVTGIVATTASIVSSLAVNTAVKFILGNTDEDLLLIDSLNMSIEKIKINKNEKCRSCSLHDYKYLGRYYSNLKGIIP